MVLNGGGCLPLHLAIEYKRSGTVVLTFLAENKQVTMVSIGSGYLPLHLAIEYKRSNTVALALLAENDKASKIKGRYGK
jgi:hypothetical protein